MMDDNSHLAVQSFADCEALGQTRGFIHLHTD
jgi:hypothetical protein